MNWATALLGTVGNIGMNMAQGQNPFLGVLGNTSATLGQSGSIYYPSIVPGATPPFVPMSNMGVPTFDPTTGGIVYAGMNPSTPYLNNAMLNGGNMYTGINPSFGLPSGSSIFGDGAAALYSGIPQYNGMPQYTNYNAAMLGSNNAVMNSSFGLPSGSSIFGNGAAPSYNGMPQYADYNAAMLGGYNPAAMYNAAYNPSAYSAGYNPLLNTTAYSNTGGSKWSNLLSSLFGGVFGGSFGNSAIPNAGITPNVSQQQLDAARAQAARFAPDLLTPGKQWTQNDLQALIVRAVGGEPTSMQQFLAATNAATNQEDVAYLQFLVRTNPGKPLSLVFAGYMLNRNNIDGASNVTTTGNANGQITQNATTSVVALNQQELISVWLPKICATCKPQPQQPMIISRPIIQQPIIQQPVIQQPPVINNTFNPVNNNEVKNEVSVEIHMPKQEAPVTPPPEQPKPLPKLKEGSVFKVVGDPQVFENDGDNKADWNMTKETRFEVRAADGKTLPILIGTYSDGSKNKDGTPKVWPSYAKFSVIGEDKKLGSVTLGNTAYDLKGKERDGPMVLSPPKPMTAEEAKDIFGAFNVVKENEDGTLTTPGAEGADKTPDADFDAATAFKIIGSPQVVKDDGGNDSIVIDLEQGGSKYRLTANSYVADTGLVDEKGEKLLKQTVISFERVTAAEPVAPKAAEKPVAAKPALPTVKVMNKKTINGVETTEDLSKTAKIIEE